MRADCLAKAVCWLLVSSMVLTTVWGFAEYSTANVVRYNASTSQPQPEQDRSQWGETQWSAHIAETMGVPADGVEARLPDATRVDILDRSRGVAWEVEWCDRSKVYEAFGQAAFYAASTGHAPGVLLLKRRGDARADEAYLKAVVIQQYLARGGVEFRLQTREVP